MSYQEHFNSEKYLDMTAYLAIRNAEKRSPMDKDWIFRRGDIYLADLNPCFGSEQGGTRPVILLQNNCGNLFSPTLIVAPITTSPLKKREFPTHYILNDVPFLTIDAVVLLEQIRAIDKRRVKKYLGKVKRNQIDSIAELASENCREPIPEEPEAP